MRPIDRAFRVGHHAQNVPRSIEDAGDVAARPVAIAGVTEGNPAIAFEPVERRIVGEVVSVVMRDRDADRLALAVAAGKDRLRVLDRQIDGPADEVLAGVAHQRARQKPAFRQDLKAVAYPQHRCPGIGCALDAAHDRAVRRHRAGTQVIAIGKSAGKSDEIQPVGKVGIAMPDPDDGRPGGGFDRHGHVAVAVRSGEGYNGGAEGHQPTFSMR